MAKDAVLRQDVPSSLTSVGRGSISPCSEAPPRRRRPPIRQGPAGADGDNSGRRPGANQELCRSDECTENLSFMLSDNAALHTASDERAPRGRVIEEATSDSTANTRNAGRALEKQLQHAATQQATRQLNAILPMWDPVWVHETTLSLRTNLTAIISMGQLLESTSLSAEQSLYTQSIRFVALPTARVLHAHLSPPLSRDLIAPCASPITRAT